MRKSNFDNLKEASTDKWNKKNKKTPGFEYIGGEDYLHAPASSSKRSLSCSSSATQLTPRSTTSSPFSLPPMSTPPALKV